PLENIEIEIINERAKLSDLKSSHPKLEFFNVTDFLLEKILGYLEPYNNFRTFIFIAGELTVEDALKLSEYLRTLPLVHLEIELYCYQEVNEINFALAKVLQGLFKLNS